MPASSRALARKGRFGPGWPGVDWQQKERLDDETLYAVGQEFVGIGSLNSTYILGHKHIDTTLGYAHLYNGTVAADYYQAMAMIKVRLVLAELAIVMPEPDQVLALMDNLHKGTLNEAQRETMRVLRSAILALAATE